MRMSVDPLTHVSLFGLCSLNGPNYSANVTKLGGVGMDSVDHQQTAGWMADPSVSDQKRQCEAQDLSGVHFFFSYSRFHNCRPPVDQGNSVHRTSVKTEQNWDEFLKNKLVSVKDLRQPESSVHIL